MLPSAWDVEEDALCALSDSERYRVCAAVFNSNYFEGKISSWNSRERIQTSCAIGSVSFQTEYGIKAAAKRFYKTERMLNCGEVPQISKKRSLNYMLSHAYESNQTFVFFRDDETNLIFLENLTIGVRLSYLPRRSSDPRISYDTSPLENSTELMGVFSAHPPPFPFQNFTFGIHDLDDA